MVSQRNGESREAYLERARKCNQKYHQEHREEDNERSRKYRQEHKEEDNARSRKYHQEHKDEDNEHQRKYHQEHKDEDNERQRKYRQEHKDEDNARSREWRQEHPTECATWGAKRRGMGFEPLNDWFEGSHSHHIDMDHVIHIPAELHRSVYHNVFTGQGMEEINELALAYWAGSEMT